MARPAERPRPGPPVEGRASQVRFDEGTLATDAPEPWPRTGPLPVQGSLQDAGRWAKDLVDHLTESDDLALERLAPAYLFPEGVVEATAELVDHQGQRWTLFAYDEADRETAGAFERACDLFERRDLPEPIYYAPAPLEPTDGPGDPFTSFGPHLLSPWPEDRERVEGTYAIWWATDDEDDLDAWAGTEQVGRTLTALEGIEPHAWARILKALGHVEEGQDPVALPEDDHQLLVEGPEGQPVLLTFSQARGLRFHLHIEQASTAYRDAFWHLVAEHYEQARANGRFTEADAGDGSEATDWWWTMTRLATTDVEVLVVGGVVVGRPSHPWSGSDDTPAVA